MARQLLEREGLSFSDLARAASSERSRFSLSRAIFSGQIVDLEAQIARLQQLVNDLRSDNQSQTTQIDFWRRRAFELEQQLNIIQSDAQRWKQLARETAEKLWDISQLAHAAVPAAERAPTDEKESATTERPPEKAKTG